MDPKRRLGTSGSQRTQLALRVGNTRANTYSYTDSNANGHTRKAYADAETASQPASSADTVKIIAAPI